MKLQTKFVAVVCAVAMCTGMLGACGSSSKSDGKGQVYYLNAKPEVVKQMKKLGDEFSKESGIKVTVESATADNYANTLTSELAKSNAPTLFTVTSLTDFVKERNYLEPLQDTEIYKLLSAEGKQASMKADGKSYTLPFISEYLTILYNKKIMQDYCSKPYAIIKSVDDIKNYDVMTGVVKDMQKHKEDLGLKAAWASPGLDASVVWRSGEHPANLMIANQYIADNKNFELKLSNKYMKYYKNFIDMQLANSPTPPAQLSGKTSDDCMSEFSLGQVAFINNGTWANTQIDPATLKPEDVGVLPYWMGIPGEEKHGVGASHAMAWGVNSKSSQADKEATYKFLKWCVSSKMGKEIMSKEMGFSVPFSTFGKDDQPTTNPIMVAAKELNKKYPPYPASLTPSSQWAKGIGDALTEYVQGTGKWDGVEQAVIGAWTTEWENYKEQNGSLPENGFD